MDKFKPAPRHFVLRTMMRFGHAASEPARSDFVFFILSFADLDDSPCRAAVEKAFSPGGCPINRVIASIQLSMAGLLGKAEYRYAIRYATRRRGNLKNID